MIKKICLILFIFIMIFSVYPSSSNAAGEIISSGDNFLNVGNEEVLNQQAIKSLSSDLYNIMLGIGIVVAVMVGAVLGIKFMTGSIEAQAKVKESLIPFVVGCIVVFGAFGIWKLVVTIGNNLIS